MTSVLYLSTIHSLGQVKALVKKYFPPEIQSTMVCIAKHESKFDSSAVGVNSNGTKDIGLFQINQQFWGQACAGDLTDPEYNTRCAAYVYQVQGVTAWVAYKKHKEECDGK